jgi:hypothetical protein
MKQHDPGAAYPLPPLRGVLEVDRESESLTE